MDDGIYKAFSQYATEMERLRQVNAALLEGCKLLLSVSEHYWATKEEYEVIEKVRKAINLAEGKE